MSPRGWFDKGGRSCSTAWVMCQWMHVQQVISSIYMRLLEKAQRRNALLNLRLQYQQQFNYIGKRDSSLFA
ncbi:unnamed protein product [Calypogeia fissa]